MTIVGKWFLLAFDCLQWTEDFLQRHSSIQVLTLFPRLCSPSVAYAFKQKSKACQKPLGTSCSYSTTLYTHIYHIIYIISLNIFTSSIVYGVFFSLIPSELLSLRIACIQCTMSLIWKHCLWNAPQQRPCRTWPQTKLAQQVDWFMTGSQEKEETPPKKKMLLHLGQLGVSKVPRKEFCNMPYSSLGSSRIFEFKYVERCGQVMLGCSLECPLVCS